MDRRRPTSLALLAAAALAAASAACAGAPASPTPPPAAPAHPAPLAGDAARLDEAARLLADGADLPMVARLLDGAGAGDPRRDLLLGQLAELNQDDAAAEAAYGRYLLAVDDDEVRLRRALALERLGRAAEVAEDLARLRPAPEGAGSPARPPQKRKLRPLLPSAR